MSKTDPATRQAFWRGHGLWRFPNFFRCVRIDGPKVGLPTAARLHYRRLTLQDAAKRLPPISGSRIGAPMPVYFMSGREHWPMTAFCAFSLLRSTTANLVPTVIDDGTLGIPERLHLSRIIPQIQYLDCDSCEARVDAHLPFARFPYLRTLRAELPLMRKLIDLHAGLHGWRLFLDSDMLFFCEPKWMLSWLRAPNTSTCMNDYQNSYGYSEALLVSTLGKPMPPRINTGFCGLQSDAIDWSQLERWARDLYCAEGANHLSEQCLVAMLIATQPSTIAPNEYKIWPDRDESRSPSAVMHHYVSESRVWYYIYGWPTVLRRSNISPV
jgi:hypothetical protein